MSIVQNPVIITTVKLSVFNPNINILYPFVSAGMPPFVMQKINRDILEAVYSLKQKQLDQLSDQGYVNPVVTMNGWYEIKTNERGVLSLTLGNYTMAYPSAHGLTIVNSLTFNINTGKSYCLNELFKKDSNYVKVLSEIVRLQIKERNIQILGEFKGISPEQYFYIADKSLVLYFQLYDITPYVFGFPYFPISVYEIESIIKEDSPLGVMLVSD